MLRRSAMTPADVALVEAWREVTYDGGRAAGEALVERCVGGDCRLTSAVFSDGTS